MNVPRNHILAPGLRDNDWAHAPHDDMRYAAVAAGRGGRSPWSVRGGDADSAPADGNARDGGDGDGESGAR